MADYLYNASAEHDISIRMVSLEFTKDKEKRFYIRQVKGMQRGPLLLRKLTYGLAMLLALKKELREEVDVVHFIWVGVSPIINLAVRWCRKKNTNIVATILNRYAPPERYIELDHLVFHSDSAQAQYIAAGFPPTRTSLIPPPVDLVNLPTPKKAEPYFVFASGPRTSAQIVERGVELLFEVFGRLKKEGHPIRLYFFGRWPEGEQELEALKLKYEADNVVLFHKHQSTLLDDLSKSSGLIVPYVGSRIGDVPLTAIEAFAVGKPVISSIGLGLDDYLRGSRAGVLIRPIVSELHDAVVQVAADAETRKQAALELSEQFDHEKFVEKHYSLYQQGRLADKSNG